MQIKAKSFWSEGKQEHVRLHYRRSWGWEDHQSTSLQHCQVCRRYPFLWVNKWLKKKYLLLSKVHGADRYTYVLLTFANIRCGRIQCDLGVNIMWLCIIFGDGVDDQLMVRSTQTNPLCFQDRIYPVLKTKWVSTVRVQSVVFKALEETSFIMILLTSSFQYRLTKHMQA